MLSAACPHSHAVSPLKYPHFFLCSLLQVYPVLSLRNIPQYRNVFLKPSKSHSEQVMDANFTIMLNEMSNGEEYFLSDNGRIRRRPSDTPTYRNSDFQNIGKDRRTGGSFGGARSKTTYIHNHMKRGHFTKDTRSTVLNTTDHESRIKEDTRKHTEDRPLIAPSFNHMTMIITVLTTMTITHKMANILNSIILSDTVPKNEN